METIPALVREIDDDAAVILMVDSNLQREFILPSEKARAYKMRMEAMKRQAGRRPKDAKETDSLVGKETRDILAEELGESAIQIQRYIRLNNLIDSLLNEVDVGKIPLNAGVALSYLDEEQQTYVLAGYRQGDFVLNLNTANAIKQAAKEGTLMALLKDFYDARQKKKEPVQKPVVVRMDAGLYQKYFPTQSSKEAMAIIEKALQAYFEKP
jgi:ParB family chromosome partitioning protein